MKVITKLAFQGGWQRGDRDPVSRTNFSKIHASRLESVIVGETSGKRSFHDQTQIIHESRIPREINHASHAFRYSRITFLFHVSRSSFSPYHASRINPLPPSSSSSTSFHESLVLETSSSSSPRGGNLILINLVKTKPKRLYFSLKTGFRLHMAD